VYIDPQQCTGCGLCVPYCPVGAISQEEGGVATVDFDGCVECSTCLRFAGCPTGALVESPETSEWPRLLRRQFSDPTAPHSSTGRRGRASGGVKTNDVTGQTRRGGIKISMEFGRPGVATRLSQIEKMSVALAKAGAVFSAQNPVTALMVDSATGEFRPEVLEERVLSATLEIQITPGQLDRLVPVIRDVAAKVGTAISWSATMRLGDDGSIPYLADFERLDVEARPNAKVNLGMGRPLVAD